MSTTNKRVIVKSPKVLSEHKAWFIDNNIDGIWLGYDREFNFQWWIENDEERLLFILRWA